jgi:peptide/nickel transport system substrate-binding protein
VFFYIAWNQRRPLFQDARVRRALTMAIDRQAIIAGILDGRGDVANSTVPPMLWNHDPEAGADLHHDPEAAQRLLSAAGWSDRDGNGILEDEVGREFRFTLMSSTAAGDVGVDVPTRIQSDLRRVGIAADVRMLDGATLVEEFENPRKRDFDAVMNGYVRDFRIDDADFFHCQRRNGRLQVTGICDPQIDRLLDTLPRIVDRETAKPLWQEYQRTVAREQPYTFLYYPHWAAAASNRLQGVSPDARGPWVGAEHWWILPDQR